MTYGSLLDYGSQQDQKDGALHYRGGCALLHEVLWFMSVSPWIMDISREVANINMKSDAKNVVTTARTIHLPEQQETVLMMSVAKRSLFRKYS